MQKGAVHKRKFLSVKKGRPFKPPQKKEDGGEKKAKWLHAKMKQLKKALKKAKQFEVLKIQRRLNQGSGVIKQKGREVDEAKLHAQLEAVKSLNLDELAVRAARSCGMLPEAAAAANDVTSPGPSAPSSESAATRVIHERVLRAGAVRKELLEVLKVFNEKFKTRLSAPVSAAPSNDKEDEEEGEEGEEGEQLEVEVEGEENAIMLGRVTGRVTEKRSKEDLKESSRDDQSEDPSGLIVDFDLDCLYDEPEGEEEEDRMTGISQRKVEEKAGGGEEEEEEEEVEEIDEEGHDNDNDSIDSRQWDQPASGKSPRHLASSKAKLSSGKKVEEEEEEGGDDDDDDSVDSRQWDLPSKPDKKKSKSSDDAVKMSSAAASKSKPWPSSAAVSPPSLGPVAGVKNASKGKAKYNPKVDDPLTKKGKMAKAKNRLGQNARRKLAEAQFGREAKHLRQAEAEKRREERATHSKAGPPGANERNEYHVVDEKLHPSWAAKRKLSITVAEPLGKKIKFDDDGSKAKGVAKGSREGEKRVQEKEKEKLHPSWEAKKKAGESASILDASGKGKKIRFDD